MYKKIILILIILSIGTISILFFSNLRKDKKQINNISPQNNKEIATTSKDIQPDKPKEKDVVLYDFMKVKFDESADPEELKKIGLDSDNDTILDEVELQIGTNPFLADTDDDGLLDEEELMRYRTDPNNPDTDGDGYLDGEEIEHGYDPLK